MTIANGKVATIATDGIFIAKLGVGTALSVTISGKLSGTINGMPISGEGDLEYTFNQGASAWVLDAGNLAVGPTLPAGDLVYVPGPGARGSMHVKTTGEVITNSRYTHLKDHAAWKLKGRTAQIKVSVLTPVAPCDYADVCTARSGPTADQYCYDNFSGSCLDGCLNHVQTSCPEV